MRVTVLNTNKVDSALQSIRFECTKMMQSLLPSNVPWFTEFFCELLLQIGIVPMQETDQDILKNIRDKDKLQVGGF